MIIIIHGSNNEQKQISQIDEITKLDNFSVNGFYIPQWITDREGLENHINMLAELRKKMSEP